MDATNNELLCAEEVTLPAKKSRRSGGKRNALAIVAAVWNAVIIGITAIRVLFLPLSFLISVVFAVIGFILVMAWSLPLSMMSIVMPLLPLGIALAVPVLLLGVIALELIPVCLGAVGLVLAIVSMGKSKKGSRSTVKITALISGIVGLVFAALSCFWLTLSALIACTPLIMLGVVCVVFLVQMIVIDIGNAAV